MKSILLALFFSVVTTIVFAQTIKVGIEGGLNIANQTLNAKYAYDKSLPAFNAGITVDVDFKDFAFQPGLLYSGQGHSQTITENPSYGQFVTKNNNTHLDYFEIPLNVVGKIHTSKNVSINLGGGPYFGMGVSAYSTYNGQTTELRFGQNGAYRALDYGANFVAEGEFNDFFLIKLNYSTGLANISHISGAGLHNHVAGLSVAFLFK
jgi:hypothetical protein